MDAVGQPHKHFRAEAYYYVMINAPLKCLTLKDSIKKSDGRTQNNKKIYLSKVKIKYVMGALIMTPIKHMDRGYQTGGDL